MRYLLLLIALGLLACSPEQTQTCSPLIIQGKLIVGSDRVLPPCGITFAPAETSIGAP